LGHGLSDRNLAVATKGVIVLQQIRRSKHRGQGLVEYAIIMMLVAMVAMAGVSLMGVTLKTAYYDTIAAIFT
jgi:Flp pilus assembly pilin Flp